MNTAQTLEVSTPEPVAEVTVDDRIAELSKTLQLADDKPSNDSGDGEESPAVDSDAEDATKEGDDASEKKGDETDEDPERAARKARREALRAREVARNEGERARPPAQPRPDAQQDVAQLQAELARLKGLEEEFRNPAKFFENAHRLGVDASQLTSYLERAVNDPSAILTEAAAKRAKAEMSPEVEALRAKVEAMEAAYEQQTLQARHASERAAAAELIAHVAKLGDDSATAAWRESFGDSQVIAIANSCLSELPEGSTMLDLLDLVEERCAYVIQRLNRQSSKQPKNPANPAHKNISARTRAERTEAIDPESEWDSLDVDERVRRLTSQLKK